MLLFKNTLSNHLKNYQNKEFSKHDYKSRFNEFVHRFPIILSTTYSLLMNTTFQFQYDIVVIDEASQSDILSTMMAMSIAKQFVIVGDSKQLSQIDNTKIYAFSEEIASRLQVPEGYRYKDRSILNSVLEVVNNLPVTILKEHYRCEPVIIDFCNKMFYNQELIIMTNPSSNDPITVIKTVPGNHSRVNPHGSGQYNEREIDEIIKIVNISRNKKIGIIAPFRYQVEKIKEKLWNLENVQVDTIHKFQGKQCDVIILSTVVNDIDISESTGDLISDFINNPRLLNVAISRAISRLYLIVSDKVFNSRNNNISEIIQYINYHTGGQGIIEGRVSSVFDILYEDYYDVMINNKSLFRNSGHLTENIVFQLLEKILLDFVNIKVAMHVRLSGLLSKLDNFEENEIKYLNHYLTHVDFVIYNNISYVPILAIEVDGVKYHEQNHKQSIHDDIKDRALRTNHISLLRLKTNQSDEENRIRNELNIVLNIK
jgi:hypothetical protein